MTINEAARLLSDELRGNRWFLAVAVGGLDEKEVIFVYTVTQVRNKFLDQLKSSGWNGYDVKIEKVGQARPATASA